LFYYFKVFSDYSDYSDSSEWGFAPLFFFTLF
jgi:hypothetical protein